MNPIPPDFVLKELTKVTIPIRKAGSLFIRCPFHQENDASLSVSLGKKVPVGIWNCFSCPAKGTWNDLALKLGLRTIDYSDTPLDTINVINSKLEFFKPIPESLLTLEPIKDKWKNYSVPFLNKFGAKRMWHDKIGCYFIYFPITYLGDRYGFIRAKTKESVDNALKYWFNFETKMLYPADYLMNYETPVVCLVEGIGDVLRLLRYGIPALTILGVTIGDIGYDILDTLCVQTIILCLDGDKPGRKAVLGHNGNEGLASKIDTKGYRVKVLFPPEGNDPDSMPYDYIKVLKFMIKQNNGKLIKR